MKLFGKTFWRALLNSGTNKPEFGNFYMNLPVVHPPDHSQNQQHPLAFLMLMLLEFREGNIFQR